MIHVLDTGERGGALSEIEVRNFIYDPPPPQNPGNMTKSKGIPRGRGSRV